MDKVFVCDVPEKEAVDFLGVFEMKNTLESLALLIAKDNEIIKTDSMLYSRLVEDYKKYLQKHNQFWTYYIEKYGHLLDEKSQLSMDFKTNKIYIIPLNA